MKCLFIFFGLIISFNFSAAQTDSVVVYDCTDEDDLHYVTVKHFDHDGNYLYTSSANETPSPSVYDSLGNIIHSESSYEIIDYVYDSQNNLISKTTMNYSSGTWQNYRRELYSYTNNLRTQTIIQQWLSSAWQNQSRLDYLYDVNQNDSCEIEYNWNGTTWNNLWLRKYFYHLNDLDDYDSIYKWSVNTNLWIIDQMDSSTYDANWNLLEYITYFFSGGVRIPSERNVYVYDSNNNQISWHEDYWSSGDNDWEQIFWGDHGYNAAGQITYSYSSCLGCGEAESSYSYNAAGLLSHTHSYSITHGGLESSSDCDVYYYQVHGPNAFCENSSIVLTADSGFTSYQWSTGAQTQSITVDSAGTYFVSMLNSNGTWFDAAPRIITESYSAVAPHGLDSTISICGVGLNSLVLPNNPNYSYEWINSSNHLFNVSIIGSNLYLPVNDPSRQSTCYRLIVHSGCDVDTSSKTCLEFHPNFTPRITVTGGATDINGRLFLCEDSTITLTAQPAGMTYSWSPNGETTSSVNVNGSGYYRVNVYDSTGCFLYAEQYVYLPPSTYPVQIIPGDSFLTMRPSYSLQNIPFTWMYNGDTLSSEHGDTIHNPSSGYYQVILDPGPCRPMNVSNILFYNDDSLLVIAGNDVSDCNSNHNNFPLSHNPAVIHGTPPYTYQWSPSTGLTNPNSSTAYIRFDLLVPGVPNAYVIKVTDALGKTGYDTVIVTAKAPPPVPVATVLDDDSICPGQNNVRVQLQPFNSSTSYSINKISGPTCNSNNVVATNGLAIISCPGIYRFTYTPWLGCISNYSNIIQVNAHPTPPIPVVSVTPGNSICNGDSICLSTTWDPSLTYKWKEYDLGYAPYADTSVFFLTHGTYWRVEVTNSYGCTSNSNWNYVSINTSFTVNVDHELPSVRCQGDSIRISFDASTLPDCTMNWVKDGVPIPGAIDSVYYATSTGHYTLMVFPQDSVCAGGSQDVFLQFRQGPDVSIIQSTNQLTAQSTNANSFQWYRSGFILPGEINSSMTISQNGIYKVIATDYHGCTSEDDYLISCGVQLVEIDPTCNGNCDGFILATPLGIPPFTYQWSNGSDSASSGFVCAGTYTLIVQDTLGCSDTTQIVLPDPPPLFVNVTVDSALCSYDCSRVTPFVTGGTPPYTYLWCDGSSVISNNFCVDISCTVIVADANGCLSSPDTFIIQIPPVMTVNALVVPTNCIGCSNGSVQVTVSGGISPYVIDWTPHNGTLISNIISNIPTGNYTILVKDQNDCADTINVFVPDDPLSVNQIQKNNIAEVFPNPVNETLTVKLNSPAHLKFYDSLGRLLFEKDAETMSHTINVSGFVEGLYFLKIESLNGVQLVRLVVDK